MTSSRRHLGNRVQALLDIRKNDLQAVLIIILLPLFVNLPGLLDRWSANPIHFVSGLASLHGKQLVRGYPWIDPTVGTYAQALGKLAADEWLSGRIPWWNYYSGVGVPLAAEMQSGALFLPFVLLNHFSNGLLYIEVIIQILAGLGTYLLLKKIELTRLAAFTGAVLYEFSGVFAWLSAPVTSPIAFLPWLILGIECAREKSLARSASGWLIVAISLAFSIYAGFPEAAYINGLLAATWSLWRIFCAPSDVRYRFIKKLMTGVIVGLLLSMPAIIPFLEYLVYSYLGGHSFNAGFGGLVSEALPQLFFPWLYGTSWSFSDESNVLLFVWSNVGGFVSAAQMTIIVLGLFATRRSSLFIVLLLWILICLGRTFALPFVSALVDLVPLLKLVALYRYAPQSWEFCSAVLCAIVINEISSGGLRSRKNFIVGLLVAFLIAIISLYPARNLVGHLYVQDGYRVFLWISLAWGFGSMVMVALAFRLGRARPLIAGRATVIILAIDAIALFSVPFLCRVTGAQTRSAGVTYLQRHLGTDRFYTLGPIGPNYGAYYRIASINHNYLPIAANWVQYIKDHLDPYSDPVCFTGNFARSDAKAPTQAEVLRENIAQYKQVGVRYVVTPHAEDPFERTSSLTVTDLGNKPFNLANGKSVVGKISGKQFIGKTVSAIRILIGNYSGKSDGILKIRLCADGFCVFGERNLQESEDNRPFLITLDQPITFNSGDIEYEFSQSGGTIPAAIWICSQKDAQETHHSASIPSGFVPKLEFVHAREQDKERPQRVFESGDMDIYELPEARPYFEIVQGEGDLHVENRSALSVNCSSKLQLIRRELSYPGWKALVDGKNSVIEPYDGIFQAIIIPPGRHKIAFSYTPTHLPIISVSFLLGVVWLTVGMIRGRKQNWTGDGFRPSNHDVLS
jgi:hypothetical protein